MYTKTSASLGMIVALITATAAAPAVAQSRGRVLIVMSGAHRLDLKDGKKYQTGFYLDELSIPLKKIVDAGYAPVFASPDGATPSIDAVSVNKMFFNGDENALADAVKYLKEFKELQHPRKLSAVAAEGAGGYAGLFLPGGHAPVQDLMTNRDLGKVLRSFHDAGKPTGVICHSPVTLVSAVSDPAAFRKAIVARDYDTATKLAQGWPYAGYRLTVFSTGEEQMIEGARSQLGGMMPFYVANALAAAGAHVDATANWHPNVIEDRELVSGQQPFSADAVGDAFVARLQKIAAR